ncbi:lysine--tRNA ligase [Candidatus Micrarchaeota archaeon CG08_land_8_20_14_0_20_59_11]|nr:MAG: lysine--tRNA ligase [Candidatus Micrarchaeota archaeon CG08_land_8_20_14_0_20_59_11]
MAEGMFWADQIARSVGASGAQVVNDSKTPSGRVHVGALRGVIIHDVIYKAMRDAGVKAAFYYGEDDYDPMDSLPVYLDAAKYAEHMGKPLSEIPAPDGSNRSYADFWMEDFREVYERLGARPEIYKMSELYKKGRLNETIRLVLENAETVRRIYKNVSGSDKGKDWLPVSVICEKCGRIGTTRAFAFDGTHVSYKCEPSMVEWAKGCGHEGKKSPFDGGGKLPWKLEWVAQWLHIGVTIEGAGKDHSTAGGARDVSEAVFREIFKKEPPKNVPYEFFLLGGKKMSSSKGLGVSAREISEIVSPELLRFLMARYQPNTAIDFNPEGDAIPRLFDDYDAAASVYFKKAEARDPDVPRIYALSQVREPHEHFAPSFSFLASLMQIPGVNPESEFEKQKGSPLSHEEKSLLAERTAYAKIWLERLAPEESKLKILEHASTEWASLSEPQQKALADFAGIFEKEPAQSKQIEAITAILTSRGLKIGDFYSAAYLIFLGKRKGPKLVPFLNALNRSFVVQRLRGL